MKQAQLITLLLTTTFVLCLQTLSAQLKPLESITVEVNSGEIPRFNAIACVDISEYDVPYEREIVIIDTQTNNRSISQYYVNKDKKILYWQIQGNMDAYQTRLFDIKTTPPQNRPNIPVVNIHADKSDNLIFTLHKKPVLQYNTEIKKLSSANSAFERNGYIHPVWSPGGTVLSEINPADHLHHYGIWNPWTSIVYDDKKYDLWNIGDKTGTVHSDSICHLTFGNLFAELIARHRHIIFKDYILTQPFVIMNEEQQIRTWNMSNDIFVWDLNFCLFPATGQPVTLSAYRYAGLAFRATANWHKENTQFMTSEGKTRNETDGIAARWIYVTGNEPQGKSGILFLASPSNHNFPEPLRTWDSNANNGRGDVMVNFAPTKYKDWILQPGGQYPFKYRIVTFDGDMDYNRAELLWKDYAYPVTVKIID